MDASQIFAEHVACIRYEDIPPEVVEITKESILDTLGVTLGASSMSPTFKVLVDLAREVGGKEESTIIGFGSRVSAFMAAFVNGAMSHFLDYDDEHYPQRLHPSAPVVCAGFAIAERLGSVNGKDLITAIAVGQDISARIGMAASWNLSARPLWQMSQLCGVFGAAATSGKLLGLDAERLVDTFGIALCQAAGTLQHRIGVGAELGTMYPAFSAKGAVLSALMAQRGISVVKNSLEGKAGFFNTYFNVEHDRNALLADLGKRFENVNIGVKPYPVCDSGHVHIDATLGIVSEHDIHPEDIEEITVYVYEEFAQRLCEPLEARRRPQTIGDAKFSLPYSVAVAATYRNVLLKNYTVEGIRDPVVLDLAQKVKPKFESRFKVARALELAKGMVEIRTKAGSMYSKTVEIPYGHPQKPLTMEKVVEKFEDCASYSVRPLPHENIEKVIHLIGKLEQVEDVSQIIKLLF